MVTSTSSSTQRYQFSGIASGIDTKSIIQGLIDAKKGPVTIMQAKVVSRRRESDAIKDINSRLNNLLAKVKLFEDATLLQGRIASVTAGGTNATISVSASTTATIGNFKVTVEQLATATSLTSAAALGTPMETARAGLLKDANLAQAVTAGSFTINGVSISVDPATQSLDQIITAINGSAAGVTASLVPDAGGNNNRLQLTSGSTINLGSGADTSNFLSATNLLASPTGSTRTSTANLGVTQTSTTLANARLATPINAGAGTFKINGVQISYDTGIDSISTVLSKINSSTANVIATYDAVNDKISLVSKATGSTSVALEDNGGNFLAATGLLGASQNLGKNARIVVDTGNGSPTTVHSTTNTVTNAVQGVSLTLLKESATADTVQVGHDLDGAAAKVQDLVSQFNSSYDFIRQQTAINKNASLSGVLSTDATISAIGDGLRRILTETIDGVTGGKSTLGEIGVSFGAAGSALGTTNLLQFDATKFKAALEADPNGVTQVLSAFTATNTLEVGGTGSLASISGTVSSIRRPGTYTVTTNLNQDGTAYLTAVFKPSDGGPEVTTTADNVAAGATNTTLIPGLSLTMSGVLTAGTNAITVATPQRGIGAKLDHYLDPLTRSNGVLSTRHSDATKQIDDMNNRITAMNERLERERTRLSDKFTRMEQAIARMQAQRSTLTTLAQAVAG